jgi:hypothetical protein
MKKPTLPQHYSPSIIFSFLLILLSLLITSQGVTASLAIQTDASKSWGTINPWLWGTYMGNQAEGATTALIITELGRDGVFPVSGKADANPDDPAEYNFTELDYRIYDATKKGLTPLVKIANITSTISKYGTEASPPKDYHQYQKMMGNIIRHLTQGWGKGYHLPVKYVELWNEPDLQAKVFWKGSQEEFYKTYEAAAKGIKSADSTIAVGGPGFAWIYYTDSEPMIKGFLDYCQKNNVPLDFLSWHQYDLVPGAYYDKAQKIDTLLKNYPKLSPLFGKPLSFNTEWNNIVGIIMPQVAANFSPMETAAHNISSIIKMMDGGVSAAYRIPAPPVWPLSAQEVLQKMVRTPQRIASTGGDCYGTTSLAGKSKDDKEVQVLVCTYYTGHFIQLKNAMPSDMYSYQQSLRKRMLSFSQNQVESPFSTMILKLDNLPWAGTGKSTRILHYQVTESGITQADSQKLPSTASLSLKYSLQSPSIHLFKAVPE